MKVFSKDDAPDRRRARFKKERPSFEEALLPIPQRSDKLKGKRGYSV